jgi:hypothetical protein
MKERLKSFDHFVTDVCKRVKRCTLNKVTNMMDWFTTMIVVANQDEVEVRKKLLLEKDLKLDMAKAICKEGEKAAKTSFMLGASRTSGKAGTSQAAESASGVSLYQSSRGRGQHRGCGAPRGGRGGFHQQDRGRSPSINRTFGTSRSIQIKRAKRRKLLQMWKFASGDLSRNRPGLQKLSEGGSLRASLLSW